MLDNAQKENKSLRDNNSALNVNIKKLQEEVRLWEGKIKNLDEKKMVLKRKAQSMQELNKRVNDLKTKAQKEIDAVKMQLGNNGYLTKNGKTTFSREKAVQLEKIVVTHPR